MILCKKTCQLYISTWIIILCIACSSESNQNPRTDIFQNAQDVKLEGENIYLKLPVTFKRTSRYRLESDFPYLKEDSVKLHTFQNMLYEMEFGDAEIDLFFDSTAEFRILIISNTAQTPFDKDIASRLNGVLNERYEAMETEEEGLQIEKLDSKIKGTDRLQMMKFKHRFEYTSRDIAYNQSVSFITTPVQTIIATEISTNEEDVEDYLWSIKEQ